MARECLSMLQIGRARDGAAMGAGRSGEDGSVLKLIVCTSKQELESTTLLNSI